MTEAPDRADILIVDDLPENLTLLENVLRDEGYSVRPAISGKLGVPGVKAAMGLAGYRGGIPRRPLLPLDDGAVAELRTTLEVEGVL